MNKAKSNERLHRLTAMAIFSAIVIVLTLLGGFIRIGPFPITLSLAPIIIGAAVYGSTAGAILGAVMGITVFVNGVATGDFAVMTLVGISPFACILVCIVKSTVAGWIAGLLYSLVERKNSHLAVICAGVACPVVNTGLFIAGMLIFFSEALKTWAGGQDVLSYVIFGMTGINFLIELGVNLALSAGITSVIRYAKGRRSE